RNPAATSRAPSAGRVSRPATGDSMKLAYTLLMVPLAACALDAAQGDTDSAVPGEDDSADGLNKETFDAIGYARTGSATTAPITYHGGPVMLGTSRVYFLWYGNWTGNTALGIVPAFTQALGGSAYFNINTTYGNGAGAKVSNALALAGQTTDNYSR